MRPDPRLLASSRTDPLAYDAAVYFLADCLRHGTNAPKVLREWGFLALTGEISRPRMKGKYPPALFWRDREIVNIIKEVVYRFRLDATSSKEDFGSSACNAVSEGLRLMKLQPDSYTAIKRVWQKRNLERCGPVFLRRGPTTV